ncbi:MAG: NCS2 family permease, partial [Pygmaiobacter sp.]
ISGVLFMIIAMSPLRGAVISAIPAPLKAAISAGIGMFIAFIGLLNADIVKLSGDVVVDGAVVATDYSMLGNILHGAPLLALIGLLVTGVLIAFNIKGAIFIGILITTAIGFPMGLTSLPETYTLSHIGNLSLTLFQFDFGGVLAMGLLPLITAVTSFLIVDMFDTVGTLLGTAGNAGMLDEDGNLPHGDKALIADAIATCVGACLGTSTVTTYVESSTGIAEGARTGLASMVTGILFLLSILLAPIAGIIPGAATAPALIIVGVYMMKSALNINWGDFEVAMPCFLTIAMMPFAYSISDGIGFGFISWTVIKLCRGKGKDVPVLMYLLSALFVAKYVLTFMG